MSAPPSSSPQQDTGSAQVRVIGPDDRGLCRIELSRPAKANALSPELVADLSHAIARAEEFEAAVIQLGGAGRNFCAGFDLSDVEEQSDGDLLLRFVRIAMLLERLSNVPAITIAKIHGGAFGAGGDLALACDYRVGCASVRFRFPGLAFGVPLGVGRLAQVVGPAAAGDLAGGEQPVMPQEALNLGLLTHLLDDVDIPSITQRLTDKWCNTPSPARTGFVQLTRRSTSSDDLAALARACAETDLARRIRLYAKASRQKNRSAIGGRSQQQ